MMEENAMLINQIEGHSISAEDRRGREHIWYNLPNLNSLPQRSSTSMSYLSASQKKPRCSVEKSLANANEEEEIQSRLKATEERITSLPFLTFNRFQVLQRRPLRKVTPAKVARSL